MRFEPDGGSVLLRDGELLLAEYVFETTDPQRESPRPYALLRTRSGVEVTAHRPDDHPWHRGLSLAVSAVGPHNFWGGPTYLHGEGYVQLPNNGAQVHRRFTTSAAELRADHADGAARLEEDLDWMSEDGARVLTEERALTARRVDVDSWALTWRSELTNVSGEELAFGSPTTHGRTDAGYGGIFWRGPVEFTGGQILDAHGPVGDAALGTKGEWLAFIAPDRSAGVLMIDPDAAEKVWFARSAEYAGMNPAPFFHTEKVVPPGGRLSLAAALVIGTADVAKHASTVRAELGAALTADLADGLRSECEDQGRPA